MRKRTKAQMAAYQAGRRARLKLAEAAATSPETQFPAPEMPIPGPEMPIIPPVMALQAEGSPAPTLPPVSDSPDVNIVPQNVNILTQNVDILPDNAPTPSTSVPCPECARLRSAEVARLTARIRDL